MKKTKIALGKKLILNKENIANLDNGQQDQVLGGGSVNICAQTDNCPVIQTAICPVIPTGNCISKKHTWCWVAGSSC